MNIQKKKILILFSLQGSQADTNTLRLFHPIPDFKNCCSVWQQLKQS